jgi:hypothetical protein
LEAFLELLWRPCDRARLQRGDAGRDADRQLEAKELEAHQAVLAAEVCEVLYLCQRLGDSPEMSESWLRERIRHFLSVMAANERAWAEFKSAPSANRFA